MNSSGDAGVVGREVGTARAPAGAPPGRTRPGQVVRGARSARRLVVRPASAGPRRRVVLLIVAIAVSQLGGDALPGQVLGREHGRRSGPRDWWQSRFPGQAGDAPGRGSTRPPRSSPRPTRSPSPIGGRAPPAAARGVGDGAARDGRSGPGSPGRPYRLRHGAVRRADGRSCRRRPSSGWSTRPSGPARRASTSQLGGTPIGLVDHGWRPGPSEGIGVTAAMLIMLIAFGSVVAMGLPILTALFGLLVGVSVLELLTHVLDRTDVLAGDGRHDRAGCRYRLCPLRRHPVPGGAGGRPGTAAGGGRDAWRPPAGRCCSPAPRSSSRCSVSS